MIRLKNPPAGRCERARLRFVAGGRVIEQDVTLCRNEDAPQFAEIISRKTGRTQGGIRIGRRYTLLLDVPRC